MRAGAVGNSTAHDQFRAFVSGLRAIGVRSGGPLLVHSSVRSLGPLDIGLDGIIAGLLQSINGGTLLLPALRYENVDWARPVFDARATPSCVGALAEHFRSMPETRRSLHLTHSVAAAGKRATEFVAEHRLDTTPVGPHSPFRKVAEAEGQILMLGCGLRPNTSMHGVEELVVPPYLFSDGLVRYRCVDADGNPVDLKTRTHDFRGFVQRYDRIATLLQEGREIRRGRILAADASLIAADALWNRGEKALRSDPFYFVQRAHR